MAPYSRTEIKTVQLNSEAKSLSVMSETQVGDPHTSNPTNNPPTPLLTPAHPHHTGDVGWTNWNQATKKGVIEATLFLKSRGLSPSSSEPQSL